MKEGYCKAPSTAVQGDGTNDRSFKGSLAQGFPTGGRGPLGGLSDPPGGPRDGLKLI